MRILFVSTWFPYPLDTGSRIRVYYLLRALATRHEVHLIAFLPDELPILPREIASQKALAMTSDRQGAPGSDSHCEGPQSRSNPLHAREIASQKALATPAPTGRCGVTCHGQRAAAFLPTLTEWGVQTEVVRRDPFWRDPVKSRLAYLSPLPRDAVAGHSPELAALVRAAGREATDLTIASASEVIPYALAVSGPRLLEEHNFMTGWMAEKHRAERSPLRRALRWLTWQKSLRYERRLYPQFAAVTMVSEGDRRAVEAAIPAVTGRVAVIPNGVDTERNRPGLAEPQPGTLVFNGALTYYANADAMRTFCGEILPAVRAAVPEVRLRITGRHDGVDLAGIAGEAGVSLTGFLEDVRPAVAGSWACVVPLRQGGGTRLKILEALALGTPVVATSKGAEGLDVTHEHDILIADDPAEFGRQTIRLLGDPGLRARLAANGRALVEAKYGWDRIGRAFCELAERTAGAG